MPRSSIPWQQCAIVTGGTYPSEQAAWNPWQPTRSRCDSRSSRAHSGRGNSRQRSRICPFWSPTSAALVCQDGLRPKVTLQSMALRSHGDAHVYAEHHVRNICRNRASMHRRSVMEQWSALLDSMISPYCNDRTMLNNKRHLQWRRRGRIDARRYMLATLAVNGSCRMKSASLW
jgi:hypothetical protein